MPSESLHYLQVTLDDQASADRVGDLARRDPWSALEKPHSGREIHVSHERLGGRRGRAVTFLRAPLEANAHQGWAYG